MSTAEKEHEHVSSKHFPEQSMDSGHTHEHPHHESDHSDVTLQKNTGDGGMVLTVRACSGLSGDIMLGGLAALASLTKKELHAMLAELNVPALEACLELEPRMVHHITGIGCRITLPHEHAHRTLGDILTLIEKSSMPDEAKELSRRAFTILAEAEAAVHGKKLESITFHEVGALDSILDICLVCRIFSLLHPVRFICSPLPLADGMIRCAHGVVPAPAPAVLRMLEGVSVQGFSGTGETVTPTAMALLKALEASFGPWPSMTVQRTVISYGTKVFENTLNGAIWTLGKQLI